MDCFQIGKLFDVESHILTPAETKKIYPLLNIDNVYGSLFSPGDGGTDPSSYCTALTKVATSKGALVKEQCKVLSKLSFFAPSLLDLFLSVIQLVKVGHSGTRSQ